MSSAEISLVLRLSDSDNVAVARAPIAENTELFIDGERVLAACSFEVGFKMAIRPIGIGDAILKYGARIGSATADIAPGHLVHTHNMASDYTPTHGRDGDPAASEGR